MADGMNEIERRGVKITPSHALSSYRGSGYRTINDGLRGTSKISPVTARDILGMDHMLDTYGVALPEDALVLRGVRNYAGGPSTWKVGQLIVEPGYTSATVDADTQLSFSGASGWSLDIHVPKGLRYVYGTNGERELVFPRGLTFRVVSIDRQPTGHSTGRMTLEVVPND